VEAMAFSPDGKALATGSSDNSVLHWDVAGTKPVALRHDTDIESLAFSPDGKTLATGTIDGRITLWSLESKEKVLTFFAHRARVESLVFLPDGRLASASVEGNVVKLCDISVLLSRLSLDRGLVGHWKFDEGGGKRAFDSSGSGHDDKYGGHEPEVSEDAAPIKGYNPASLRFDPKKTTYLALPNSPLLEKVQEGSYTLSAWFKPASVPPGKQERESDHYYAILVKTGHHLGLSYTASRKFRMQHWYGDGGGDKVDAQSKPIVEQQGAKWHHVAGVVDQSESAKSVTLYVDGKESERRTRADGLKTRDYGKDNQTWKIGIGNVDRDEDYRWAADGWIDEVRIYNRALSAEEIKQLAGK
jgi:hypothetical protein